MKPFSLYAIEPIMKPVEKQNVVSSNWEYRKYMQMNAKDIMKYNAMQYFQDSGNNPYATDAHGNINKTPINYNISEMSQSTYGYCDSDLKRQYIKKEQMKSKMVAPNIPVNKFKK
jgi:hypothetical protein